MKPHHQSPHLTRLIILLVQNSIFQTLGSFLPPKAPTFTKFESRGLAVLGLKLMIASPVIWTLKQTSRIRLRRSIRCCTPSYENVRENIIILKKIMIQIHFIIYLNITFCLFQQLLYDISKVLEHQSNLHHSKTEALEYCPRHFPTKTTLLRANGVSKGEVK